jgi:small-conductance mechanosensitive channel
MIERIKNILFSPKTEWEKIKTETTNTMQVFTGYAIPLALITPIFGLLGLAIIGQRYGFGPISGVFRIPFTYAIVWGVVYYILNLVALFVEGIVINALANPFGSKPSAINALKVAVYSATPGLLAGVFQVIPALGILAFLCSLYGLYLLYLGLPVMMETPKDKLIGYFVVIIIVMIVLYFVVGAIAGAVLAATWRPIF